MFQRTRREFIADVGRGALFATVGGSLAIELGWPGAWASEGDPLVFGPLEPLVGRMQDTPIAELQPWLVQGMRAGDFDLRRLVAAAALANARKFGGDDYVGYHIIMALAPAYTMASELPATHRALPVLKVLYRNTDHIQGNGGGTSEVLRAVQPAQVPSGREGGERLREVTRRTDMDAAERTFASLARGSPEDAYNALQYIVHDDVEVHQVVLAHRAWALLNLVGDQHAHTMLRESVRFCVNHERRRIARGRPEPPVRTLLPKLLDEYGLLDSQLGTGRPDDARLNQLKRTIYDSSRDTAAAAAAAALAEGMAPDAVGEAISLAANELQLRDRGRRTHGACLGVHASDSANAWRNIARVTNPRNTAASLIVGAYHISRNGEYVAEEYPLPSHREAVRQTDARGLLAEADAAIRDNDQGRACAAVARYGELGYPEAAVFDLLRRYAISEDGRLHAEKYYVTVREEFATTRPAYRWRHLVGLARATASAYGYSVDDRPGHRAPGYEEACRLLAVES